MHYHDYAVVAYYAVVEYLRGGQAFFRVIISFGLV